MLCPGCWTRPVQDIVPLLARVRDPALKHSLEFGVGMLAETQTPAEQQVVKLLFESGAIQVCVGKGTAKMEPGWTVGKGTYKTFKYQDSSKAEVGHVPRLLLPSCVPLSCALSSTVLRRTHLLDIMYQKPTKNRRIIATIAQKSKKR